MRADRQADRQTYGHANHNTSRLCRKQFTAKQTECKCTTFVNCCELDKLKAYFDGVVLDEHHTLELLSLGHVERWTAALFWAPSAVDERVAHDHVVLAVTWIDMKRRVARTVVRPSTKIHWKPAPAYQSAASTDLIQLYITRSRPNGT